MVDAIMISVAVNFVFFILMVFIINARDNYWKKIITELDIRIVNQHIALIKTANHAKDIFARLYYNPPDNVLRVRAEKVTEIDKQEEIKKGSHLKLIK